MRILFTRTDAWMSRTIRDIAEEDVSHTAVEFPDEGVVVHSDMRGLHILTSRNFRKNREVVYEIEILDDIKFTSDRVQDIFETYGGNWYDFGAFVFLGVSLICRKYFSIPLPKSNLWSTTGMFLCTGWDTKLIFDSEDDMITPKKLYLKLKDLKEQGLL